MTRSVGYAEVPGFYAQVERAGRPELARRPIVVGGDPRKGGLVQAATEEAEARGVVPGMPVLEALERCPEARALPTRMRRYREVGAHLCALLRRECRAIEEAGFGAAYFVVREGVDPEALAASLRRRIGEDLGLPLRVGMGPVKLVARLAAQESGAQGFRRVGPSELESFLHPLPVTRLEGVGANTAAALAKHDVHTVGELATLGRARLEEILGNRGLELLERARGRDPSPVRATPHPKSLSQETTLSAGAPSAADAGPGAAGPDGEDAGVLSERLQDLAEALERRLALEGLAARRVALKVRFADGTTTTRSATLDALVAEAGEIHAVALRLLGRSQAGSRPVRLVGISLSRLRPIPREGRQLDLFSRGT